MDSEYRRIDRPRQHTRIHEGLFRVAQKTIRATPRRGERSWRGRSRWGAQTRERARERAQQQRRLQRRLQRRTKRRISCWKHRPPDPDRPLWAGRGRIQGGMPTDPGPPAIYVGIDIDTTGIDFDIGVGIGGLHRPHPAPPPGALDRGRQAAAASHGGPGGGGQCQQQWQWQWQQYDEPRNPVRPRRARHHPDTPKKGALGTEPGDGNGNGNRVFPCCDGKDGHRGRARRQQDQ
mmetsp:Transcript_8859/g.26294  ORF Transcript_8859/g.26294 Transcript_8859/m.26294 type:complete len:234 (+) Transcript_8859:272-973(+)